MYHNVYMYSLHTIAFHDEILYLEEMRQVTGMIANNLRNMI